MPPGQVWRGVCCALTAPGKWPLPSLLYCNRLDSRAFSLPFQCLQHLLVGRGVVFRTDLFQLPHTRSGKTMPTPYHWCLGLGTIGFVTTPTCLCLWPSSLPARTFQWRTPCLGAGFPHQSEPCLLGLDASVWTCLCNKEGVHPFSYAGPNSGRRLPTVGAEPNSVKQHLGRHATMKTYNTLVVRRGPWFLELAYALADSFRSLLNHPDLSQPLARSPHQNPSLLHLFVWPLSGGGGI